MAADQPEKSPANSGSRQASVAMKRKERLAEELRANLKRRKAAARRHKEDAVGEEDAGPGAEGSAAPPLDPANDGEP
jgi:hypothetical protein